MKAGDKICRAAKDYLLEEDMANTRRWFVPAAVVLSLAGSFAVQGAAQAQAKPVVLRFAADFSPPPHPAGIALKYFHDRLPPAWRFV